MPVQAKPLGVTGGPFYQPGRLRAGTWLPGTPVMRANVRTRA